TASTVRPATSRTRRRTSSGPRPKAAAARTIRTCDASPARKASMSRSASLTAAAAFLALAAAALSAPAGAQSPPRIAAGTEARSPYGMFLAGREALNEGDSVRAAELLAMAAASAPDDPLLRERAFMAALAAGDVSGAANLAPRKDQSP